MGKLQYKLFQILLLTSIFPLLAVSIITVAILQRIAVHNAQEEITHNLNIAQTIYQNVNEDLKYIIRDQNRTIFTHLENNQVGPLRAELKKTVLKNNLDFFVITDANGKVIISASNPQSEGESLSDDYSVQKAKGGEISVSTEILNEEGLKIIGLIQQAKIPGVDKAQGLVIKAVLPVINREEKIIGTMSAGYLLNNNNKIIIDKIKRTTGLMSCIFLGDLRVCSNMPSKGGEHVVGERLETAKMKQVPGTDRRYIGQILVMGERYISGNTPIYNSNREIVGSLGVSIPEASIFTLRNNLIKIFALAVFFSIFLASIFGFLKGGSIVRSIKRLKVGTEAVSKGDFEHSIGINSKDEIEELADFFNEMTLQLKIYKRQIDEYSRDLEIKVRQRTIELEAANKQLVEYERMAAMGKMATAISHELRNVLAGIQTVAYYIKSTAAKECPKLTDSIQDIDDDVNYANNILDNISRFSRPKKLMLVDVDINLIVEDVLSSFNFREMFKKNNIEITRDLDPTIPKIKADGVQIKEVVLNLVINAVQAMQNSGRLGIVTKKDGDYLRLEAHDTGGGISQEALKNLFTPFFTTKSKGLGLGLCISKEIIEAHQGKIEVQAELNKGTVFIVTLPLNKEEV